MKGSDVYLECGIKANPPTKRVEWYHNVSKEPSSRARCADDVVDDESAWLLCMCGICMYTYMYSVGAFG